MQMERSADDLIFLTILKPLTQSVTVSKVSFSREMWTSSAYRSQPPKGPGYTKMTLTGKLVPSSVILTSCIVLILNLVFCHADISN
ncbi:hypothetical protein HYALB_00000863 [Hymenoscyphus albidus]|uniref:Uncharacterized protein n=1 Tax=Hymenoscyphus albidus TaxID=595503 RepID=A0A9N9LEI6_9HELO|nr:hypothetical protein HYALB_00000863 [Hymenoscyphus albidus]